MRARIVVKNKRCYICGAEFRIHDEHCSYLNSMLVEYLLCPECGKMIEAKIKELEKWEQWKKVWDK